MIMCLFSSQSHFISVLYIKRSLCNKHEAVDRSVGASRQGEEVRDKSEMHAEGIENVSVHLHKYYLSSMPLFCNEAVEVHV